MSLFNWSHTLFCTTPKPETSKPETTPQSASPGPVRERIALSEQRIQAEINGLLADLKPRDLSLSMTFIRGFACDLSKPSVNLTLTF